MSFKYSVAGNIAAVTTTHKSMASILGAAAVRPMLYDVIVGADGTPADNAMQYQVERQTTAGTFTAFTPLPLDSADVAAVTVAGINATIEPTITATSNLLSIPVNQRASFRWVAAPDSEIKAPATANNGLVVTALSPAYTGTAKCTAMFME